MTQPLRILLIEDSPTDAKLVVHELRKLGRPIETERVQDPEAMRAALQQQDWDLAICDWSMPRFSARGALAILEERALDLPLIIVSGTVGEEAAVEAMRAGARDYVLKDRLGRLTAAIERELKEREERAARRRAEQALRASERRFARLADSGIIGIVVADVLGGTLDANDAYLRIIGYSRDELNAGEVRWNELTPPEWRASDRQAIEQLQATGVAHPWEKELFRRDGSRVPVLMGVAMLEYPRCIVFIADLTAQKRAEHERALLVIQAKTAQVGRERAEDALRESEEQLRQAQKMEAVGRLAGGVAHDFNNVLSVILSYGDFLLADLRPGDPMRSDVEEIRKAAERAAGLTRQLLLFSRQQATELQVVDLNDVLGTMDKMLQRMVGEDVELVCTLAAGLGRVRVNLGHIEQVIMNLIVNARDAMPKGGKLRIETSNVVLEGDEAMRLLPTKPGPHVLLTVSDTGMGMDKSTQARVFEPFFTTKEKHKGTGLGLSTVFGIVQQSGGCIELESEPGQGTTFKIYIPMSHAELGVTRPQQGPAVLRGTETILLVEDEAQVRTIAVEILRKHGYTVISAQNAGEALLICEKHAQKIDLLLTDVVMPEMSGPELAKRLAAGRPGMKVLCMSGYTDDLIAQHGVAESGLAFFQKPITPIALTRRVREVLDAGENA